MKAFWIAISTNADKSKKFYYLLKLMQEPSIILLSEKMRKNQNLNVGIESSFCTENGVFHFKTSIKHHFQYKMNFLLPSSNFDFSSFFTQGDHRRLLHKFQYVIKIFTCVCICAYASITVKSCIFIEVQKLQGQNF